MAASTPLRIRIPAIAVDSSLIGLGLKSDGTMQVPSGGFPAGWYNGAPTPGELGPAIIVGHVDWAGKAGVFYRLKQLKPNDTIVVGRADGSSAIFRISSVQTYAKNKFPTALIYGNLSYSGLRLITCGGVFDPKAHSYVDNVVVYAELAGTSPAKASA
jgi:sortase (surface protein transpeptidase)